MYRKNKCLCESGYCWCIDVNGVGGGGGVRTGQLMLMRGGGVQNGQLRLQQQQKGHYHQIKNIINYLIEGVMGVASFTVVMYKQ